VVRSYAVDQQLVELRVLVPMSHPPEQRSHKLDCWAGVLGEVPARETRHTIDKGRRSG
jgi:hypothetical protein